MGNIRIPQALAQMDGMFGYQVVTKQENMREKQTLIVKKDFFDWVYDLVFKIEKAPQIRKKTLAAFRQIAEQIEGVDDGHFKNIVQQYENNNEPVDYCKIRKTLAAALEYHPPSVRSRPASNSVKKAQNVDFFKKLYSQNIKKSICNEEVRVELEIFRDDSSGDVSDASLLALMLVVREHSKSGKLALTINEPNYVVKSRAKIINYQLSENSGTTHSHEETLKQSKRQYRLKLLHENPQFSISEVKKMSNTAYQALKTSHKSG